MRLQTKLTKHLHFSQADPLGAGLAEEIAVEQQEPDAMLLEEAVDEDSLSHYWQAVQEDIEKDPEWFQFSNE